MNHVEPTLQLTHGAALAMLAAAAEEAALIGQPQCIVIVDASGEVLGVLRMTGAKYLSLKSARAKARTSASIGAPSHTLPVDFRPGIAAATGGDVTGLGGGLPIVMDGTLVGGIGVGSGSAEQDIKVGQAALAAIGAEPQG